MTVSPSAPRILRIEAVAEIVCLAKPTIHWKVRNDPTFPKPLRLGPQARGWLESEVLAWIEARIAEREASDATPADDAPASGVIESSPADAVPAGATTVTNETTDAQPADA